MKDNSKYIAIGLVIVTLIVVVVTNIMKDNNEEKVEKEPLIVNNYSDFYTVNSCLYRAITYISTDDRESLLLLVSDDYKNQNKITKENVLDSFHDVEANSTFVSQKMYYENLNNDITKYYIKGYIKKNELFDDRELVKLDTETEYFIVYLDSSNGIFAIEPYNGEIFEEGDVNE